MAIRFLVRYRASSILNLIGLITGMTGAMIILLWVDHNVSMDSFHTRSANIYKLLKSMEFESNKAVIGPPMPGPLGPAIKEEIPEIQEAVRLTWTNRLIFSEGQKNSYERGFYADSSFFRVFSFELVSGDPAAVLNSPDYVVVSEKLSGKYFGRSPSQGKTIMIGNDLCTISGVFRNVPANSSLAFDFVRPFSKYYKLNRSFMDRWDNSDLMTYILVVPGSNPGNIDKKINEVTYAHYGDAGKYKLRFFTQPLRKTFLYSDFSSGIQKPTGKIVQVRIMILVAFFLILLACMNYVNMSTALATIRFREIGMKTIFGAGRGRLKLQFILESILICVAAFLLSYVLSSLLLPVFNRILQVKMTYAITSPLIKFIFFSIPLLTGLLAGLIPAITLSAVEPLSATGNLVHPVSGKISLRHFLISIQFIITISFILSSIVIFRQVQFILRKDIGLDRRNVIIFNQNTNIQSHRETFKKLLKEIPGVSDVTYVFNEPLNINSLTGCSGRDPSNEFLAAYMVGDADFIKTMGIRISSGEKNPGSFKMDNTSILINQEMAKSLGYDNPLGQPVKSAGQTLNIIGVVDNFNFNSLRVPVRQLMIFCGNEGTEQVLVRIKEGSEKETLKKVEAKFSEFEKGIPFEYSFLDEKYSELYSDERSVEKLSYIFMIIAVIISCTGLFGLALFTTARRSKEIGIRKAHGAETGELVLLLLYDFLKWIVLSFFISGIISFIILNGWLRTFAYHTSFDWLVFIAAGLITTAITLTTVSAKCIRTAGRNPVDVLKHE